MPDHRGGERRLPLRAAAAAGLAAITIAAASFGAAIGAQAGHHETLSELHRLCEAMPDIAHDNPSMCFHIEAMLP